MFSWQVDRADGTAIKGGDGWRTHRAGVGGSGRMVQQSSAMAPGLHNSKRCWEKITSAAVWEMDGRCRGRGVVVDGRRRMGGGDRV